MYKVMIAEKNTNAIRSIKTIFPAETSGFYISSEITDPAEAVRLFEKGHIPDILITEMFLAGMTGLELAQNAQHYNCSVKVLIITNQTFHPSPAKKSIEISIHGYLLKSELNAQLLLKNLLRLSQYPPDTTRQLSDSETASAPPLAASSSASTYVLIVLREDLPYPLFHEAPKRNILPKALFSQYGKFIPEILECQEQFSTASGDTILLYRCRFDASYKYLAETIRLSLYDLHTFIKLKTGLSYTLSFHISKQASRDVSSLYEACQKYFSYRVFGNHEQYVGTKMFRQLCIHPVDPQLLYRLLEDLYTALYQERFQQADTLLETLFKTHLHPSCNIELLNQCVQELIIRTNIWCTSVKLPPLAPENPSVASLIDSCYTCGDIQNLFQTFFSDCARLILDKKLKFYSRTTRKAICYMSSHYKEPLAVSDITTSLHISESYLSRIFKQDTGSSVISYLSLIRMNEAKRLLRNSDFKIYEIAVSVGFTSSQYFSKVFSKYVGISPLDYRRTLDYDIAVALGR